MKQIKAFWNALDGKKTAIGVVLHAAWFITNVVFKDLSTADETITGHVLIGTITGVGISHKVTKAIESVNKNTNFKK